MRSTIKCWDYVRLKVMHSECWISMRFSFSRCLLCSKLFNKSQLQCNICYVLCVLAWNCHYSECIIDWCVWWRHAIPATFMYSSGDLLLFEFRFIIIGFAAYYCSWKCLTLWRRNYFFFLILAHPVYKMSVIQEPNKLALWNKLHFEEKKPESIEHV